MADVLIVCVREDELQAKALADMFERAGFSVGGAPAGDGALRSTGAGVIVWSQASIRSRPFLDAAQRVIDAEKAVVASLIDPPPAHTINNAPAFALIDWTGDPEDQALDPLFFAVDRMVTSQRAAVGAAPARPTSESFQEPPSLRPPPSYGRSRSDEPSPRHSARSRTPVDPPRAEARPEPIGAEAEHWRAIRDSRDPADYLDYLARYGPQGAFAEVAQIKLKQLTGSGAPLPPPATLRDAAKSAAPPARARRLEPPPPMRAEPPPRRLEPLPPPRMEAPMRRPEPPPPPRRPDPPVYRRESAPPYERPPLEARSGSSPAGGIVRLLILVILLGGGAFAARYFLDQPPTEQTADAAPDAAPPADIASNEPLTGADGVGGAYEPEGPPQLEAAPPVQQPAQRAAPVARQQPPRAAPQRASAQAPAREAEEEAPPPAPRTSWGGDTSTAASGGPASLLPGASPAAAPTILAANNPPPLAPAPTITRAAPAGSVSFTQRPSPRRIAELYPERAQRDGIGGRAVLDCVVRADLALSCVVGSETPASAGFGRAALGAANGYRVRPTLSDGSTAQGSRTRIVIVFQPPAD